MSIDRLFTYINIFLTVFSISACSQNKNADSESYIIEEIADTAALASQTDIPNGAKSLILTYHDFIKGYKGGYLILSDGRKILYDDGKEKSYIERLDHADVEDMFAQSYDTSVWEPSRNYDPGRIRNEALFKVMYGESEQEVRKHLIKVNWFNQVLPFTSVNGAADSLRKVEEELKTLPSEYHKYFDQSSSFYWRTVRGCNRLSAHSYGMTIDICTKYSDFWRWKNPGKEEMDEIEYVNRIPKEIIRIFEKHGFISGARWYHFDTMHFEFRPDLIKYSRDNYEK